MLVVFLKLAYSHCWLGIHQLTYAEGKIVPIVSLAVVQQVVDPNALPTACNRSNPSSPSSGSPTFFFLGCAGSCLGMSISRLESTHTLHLLWYCLSFHCFLLNLSSGSSLQHAPQSFIFDECLVRHCNDIVAVFNVYQMLIEYLMILLAHPYKYL